MVRLNENVSTAQKKIIANKKEDTNEMLVLPDEITRDRHFLSLFESMEEPCCRSLSVQPKDG